MTDTIDKRVNEPQNSPFDISSVETIIAAVKTLVAEQR